MASRSLRGLQRLTAAELRRNAREAATAMKRHRAGCYDCFKARLDPYRYCDEGWALAKAESRAQYALRKWTENEDRGQERLF